MVLDGIFPVRWMERQHRVSVAQLLAVLLVIAIAPIGIAATVLLVHHREETRQSIRNALVHTASNLTVALDRELARGRAMLETLAASEEAGRGDWANLYELATRAVRRYPNSAVAATSSDGQLIFRTSTPFGTALPNVWDVHKEGRTGQWEGHSLPLGAQDLAKVALETNAPAYSNLYLGLSSNSPRVAVAIPVHHTGRAPFTLTLSFSPAAAIHELLLATQGTDLRLAVIDQDGVVIATNGKTVLKTGDRVSKRFLTAIADKPTGMITGPTAAGEPALVAFSRSPVTGWIVRVARHEADAYRSITRTSYLWSAISAGVLALTCTLGWLLSRRISVPLRALALSLKQPVEARRTGHKPTHIREIDALSAASSAAAVMEMERAEDRMRRVIAEQNALKASEKEQWLRLVLNNLFVFVGILDRTGRVLEVNEAPLVAAGLSRDQVIGRPVWDCHWCNHDAEVSGLLRSSVERAANGETVRFDLPIRVKDGKLITVDFQLAPIVEGDGAIRYLIPSGVDVTERVETTRALGEMSERKNEFIAMLSHELRNPLAPIMTALALLNDQSSTAEVQRKAGEILNRQVAHLARLVNDLVDVNRFMRGKVNIDRKLVDLRELARNAVEDYRPEAAARQLVVTFDGKVDRLPVNADGARITQVIKNLLENALKHTPRGGSIDVIADVSDNEAVLIVKDTGQGIRPQLLPQIFDPFFQGTGPLGSTHGGLGLGLALVKDIVERHEGSVTVQSEGHGKGTTFTIRLPLAVDAPTDSVPSCIQSAAAGKSILVVDDNIDNAESIALLLRMHGHNAEFVTSGDAALRHVARRTPDLVICDLGMPGMDGYTVARELKASHPHLPLIALTGFAHPDDLQRAFQAGFDFHIAKPVEPEALAVAVAEATGSTRSSAAAKF